jgi:hypothetical protein
MNVPKVFLSHASEDKPRFVDNFAQRLRADGVDAWLDKWEMLPGDSLVDKIFEEGLKEADAVIVVLSQFSILKRWIKEELNTSVVSRISKGTRIIPIVLDGCELPEALHATLWEPITDTANYGQSYERILASIFGTTLKPAIGQPPGYTTAILTEVDGLESIDNLVLKTSCEFLLENPDHFIDPKNLFGESNPDAPPKSEVIEAINVLEDRGYFSVSRSFGGGPEHWGCHYRVTFFGFQQYCSTYVPKFGAIVDQAAGLIANKEADTNFKLRDSLKIQLMIANHIIRLLENKGYLRVSKEISERILIYDVSAKLRRAIR